MVRSCQLVANKPLLIYYSEFFLYKMQFTDVHALFFCTFMQAVVMGLFISLE